MARGRKRRQRGGCAQQGAGIGDVFRKVVDVGKKVNQFAKDNKLATKALGAIDVLGGRSVLASNPIGQAALMGLDKASQAGYGRRRRSQRGRGAIVI